MESIFIDICFFENPVSNQSCGLKQPWSQISFAATLLSLVTLLCSIAELSDSHLHYDDSPSKLVHFKELNYFLNRASLE